MFGMDASAGLTFGLAVFTEEGGVVDDGVDCALHLA